MKTQNDVDLSKLHFRSTHHLFNKKPLEIVEEKELRDGIAKLKTFIDLSVDPQFQQHTLWAHELISWKTKDGLTALHLATQQNQIAIIELFHFWGMNFNLKTHIQQLTGLHIAIQQGYTPIASFLISRGADVNAKTDNGMTPLHFAICNKNLQIIKELLDYEANIESTTNSGLSPLDLAIQIKNPKIVQTFVDKKADIHKRLTGNVTPLYMATKNNLPEIVEILLRAGADPSITNGVNHETSFACAERNHCETLITLFKNCTITSNSQNTVSVTSATVPYVSNSPRVRIIQSPQGPKHA